MLLIKFYLSVNIILINQTLSNRLLLIKFTYISRSNHIKENFMNLQLKEIMSARNVTSALLAEKVGISKVAVEQHRNRQIIP